MDMTVFRVLYEFKPVWNCLHLTNRIIFLSVKNAKGHYNNLLLLFIVAGHELHQELVPES